MTNDEVLKKAERILKGNIYPENRFRWGDYRMISPGLNQFLGIWNWDSAFHAVGILDFDPELAKEQILGFLQFQHEDGFLPDVIWENGAIEDRLTKPPVMAWATAEVFKKTQDTAFLQAVYPKLVLNERFWTQQRMHCDLFHYDADRSRSKDDEEYHNLVGWDSGWDNSPRWDGEPQNCWAIDLNCFMVMTYRALSYLAKAIGLAHREWDDKEKRLVAAIEQKLWNDDLQAYTDFDFAEYRHTPVLTPASFMPLYIETATKERAEQMNEIAVRHFLPGMPTVAYDDPAYGTGSYYWRGPCWLNVAYFAAKGLQNYGYDDTARTIRDTIVGWVANDGEFIHENYNAMTGEGLCCDHFSWSCVFVRKFILEF